MKRIIILSNEIDENQENTFKDILENYNFTYTKLDNPPSLSDYLNNGDAEAIFVDAFFYINVKNIILKNSVNRNNNPFIFLLVGINRSFPENIDDVVGIIFLDKNRLLLEKQLIFAIKHILLEKNLKNYARVINPEFLRKLLGDTAHAINNILTGMQGYAELALLNPDDKKLIEDSFKVVMDSSYRVRNEIKNLRAFVRIENPRIENITIGDIIREAIELVKPHCRTKNCNIDYIMEKNYVIKGDKDQLVQVFFNILGDFIESANGNSKITIDTLSNNGTVNIKIFCDRCSLTKEEYDTIRRILAINEPVLKMDSKEGEIENKNVLSMCNRIVVNHKGNLKILNDDSGVFYMISLPYINQPEVEISKSSLSQESQIDSFENLDMDVLVVDDEEFVRNTLYYFFQQKGCRVTLAEDGKYGLEIAKQKPFDIIFMDYLMPKMGGVKAAKEILKNNSDVKIVFITGKEVTDEGEIMKSGVYHIIKKPFEISDIYSVAKKVAMEKGLGG